MSLQWPLALVLLLLPIWLAWRSRGVRSAVGDGWPRIRRGAIAGGRLQWGAWSKMMRPWRFWLALVLIALALARPQWGRVESSAYVASGEILLALDLSRSMLARDVVPSRLERARMVAQQLLGQLPEQRIGLAVFAGSAYLLVPPRIERSAVTSYLHELTPQYLLDQGTELSGLLELAQTAFNAEAAARCLVVLSDGEAADTAWRAALPALAAQNLPVVSVAIGTEAGADLVADDGRHIRDRAGRVVRTRLDRPALEQLAHDSGGAYFEGADPGRISQFVRLLAMKADRANGGQQQLTDRFQWLLAAALALLAWSAVREWPALPYGQLRRVRGASAVLATVAGAGLLVGALGPQASLASTELTSADTAGDATEDPLADVSAVVAAILTQDAPQAADYQALAEAAVRYGEANRRRERFSEGVLSDGLHAVERGRRLEPGREAWAVLEAQLRGLLEPPLATLETLEGLPQGEAEPDADGEGSTDGSDEAAVYADADAENDEQMSEGAESAEQNGAPSDRGTVGGGKRQVYDPAEWRDVDLVLPLHQLELIRDAASPSALFKVLQESSETPPVQREQTW